MKLKNKIIGLSCSVFYNKLHIIGGYNHDDFKQINHYKEYNINLPRKKLNDKNAPLVDNMLGK